MCSLPNLRDVRHHAVVIGPPQLIEDRHHVPRDRHERVALGGFGFNPEQLAQEHHHRDACGDLVHPEPRIGVAEADVGQLLGPAARLHGLNVDRVAGELRDEEAAHGSRGCGGREGPSAADECIRGYATPTEADVARPAVRLHGDQPGHVRDLVASRDSMERNGDREQDDAGGE
jgi:hypothetical protein